MQLTQIYMLTNQDVIDFNSLNARPENAHGPQVPVMSYRNSSPKSIVVCNITGTPGATLPGNFRVTDNAGLNEWVASGNLIEINGQYCIEVIRNEEGKVIAVSPTVFDSNGMADNVYFEAASPAELPADEGTLTVILTPSPDVSSVTNPNDASAAGQQYSQCVDKTTTDNPAYSDWADAMEINKPISTREIYTLMV